MIVKFVTRSSVEVNNNIAMVKNLVGVIGKPELIGWSRFVINEMLLVLSLVLRRLADHPLYMT